MIAIVDYGMGNRRSVEKAFAHVGATATLTADHGVLRAATGLVVPGVGAFPEAMRRLEAGGLADVIRDRAAAGTPVIGLCLGMQLLFERSHEHEGAEGIGLIGGDVVALDAPGLKVPHMGWSRVEICRHSRLVDGDAATYYHVHSFVCRPADPDVVVGEADYGGRFCSIVEDGCLFGAQFHPEKSSAEGLRLLRRFADVCAGVAA